MAVVDTLPSPSRCDFCSSRRITLIKNHVKTERGSYRNAWYCMTCKAMVSCHPDSNMPTGYMTDTEGRNLRKRVHFTFDKIWRDNHMSRDDAYIWLGTELLLSRQDAHISRLTKDNLRKAIILSKRKLESLEKIAARRKLKSKEKRIRENEQHRRIVKRRRDAA